MCVCPAVYLCSVLVYELLTNEQQISLRLKKKKKICGHFMDIIMA